ncbi:beta-phosphoglucomutase (beta-PGM) domain-containing protein [Mycoplasmopsis citelli]|uniref:Beta-phosphoglucomutase (Beta-PGM) domain-containing protein n=1 Tax=Mycoplasmopsis citelli TaxID=171281 RepID=A0A449B3E6_9BACT|nr:beta-phosphoglucomutase [Mycoplasmopsis citelli]VEU75064.1 beta-phosphoglucomutase (beta-PGM) domain-containing protein [Mycoplasmopsis citelli]
MNKEIKGFVFDLDGVLTDTAHLHYLAWKNELAKYNIEYSQEENEPLKGLPRKETLVAILKLKNLLSQFSEQKIEQMCFNKNEEYKQMLQTSLNPSAILPGIENFLKELKNKKYKLAVASSSHNAPLILEKIQLINYFDFIVDPANVKNGKPAPDIYLLAAQGMNLVPQECVGIEDAPSGVKSIIEANMRSIAIIPQGQEHLFDHSDLVIHSTEELILNDILTKI